MPPAGGNQLPHPPPVPAPLRQPADRLPVHHHLASLCATACLTLPICSTFSLPCSVTSSSSSFRESKLIRDGGSGKLLLQCCASGQRRHAWVVYNAKGDEVLHVRLSQPSWWRRLRRNDAGGHRGRRAACCPQCMRIARNRVASGGKLRPPALQPQHCFDSCPWVPPAPHRSPAVRAGCHGAALPPPLHCGAGGGGPPRAAGPQQGQRPGGRGNGRGRALQSGLPGHSGQRRWQRTGRGGRARRQRQQRQQPGQPAGGRCGGGDR